jgi:putative nucleotidyltransferase with HDIG domain
MIKLQSKKSGRASGTCLQKFRHIGSLFFKPSKPSRKKGIAGPGSGPEVFIKRLELLYEDAQNATFESGVSKLLEEILHMTNEAMRVSASSFLLIGAEKEGLYFQVAEKRAGKKLFQMTISLDSGIAKQVIGNGKPLIINDVTKDERFNNDIDLVTGLVTKSVMAAPLLRGQKVIGILEVINRVDGRGFDKQDLATLTSLASNETIILLISMLVTATNNITQHQILIDWYKSVFETLIAAIDTKDLYSSNHSSRVKKYVMMAARSLSLPLEELQAIELGALLHDIGKIWIHDNVLRKTGPLTDEEWYIMRKHALKGAHMLNGIPNLEKARDIVLYHHERYDGKGYPRGLKGGNIPIGARLVAVADAYDAMTTEHAYRGRMTIDEAISQLTKGKGTQFCPKAVDAFIAALEKSEEKAKEDTGKPPKSTVTAEVSAVSDPDIYDGDIKLAIISPDGFREVRQFKKCLEDIKGLKVTLESWTETEGIIIVVSVQEPMALPVILSEMPMVEKVTRNQKSLLVTLKTPAERKVFEKGYSLVWPR